DGMVVGLHVASDVRFEIRIAHNVLSRKAFRPGVFRQRGSAHDASSPSDALNKHSDVVMIGKIVGVDERRLERIVRCEANLAAAPWAHAVGVESHVVARKSGSSLIYDSDRQEMLGNVHRLNRGITAHIGACLARRTGNRTGAKQQKLETVLDSWQEGVLAVIS